MFNFMKVSHCWLPFRYLLAALLGACWLCFLYLSITCPKLSIYCLSKKCLVYLVHLKSVLSIYFLSIKCLVY